MDDYDGILKFYGLKYSPFKKFEIFWFINFYGDQHIGQTRTRIKTRPFCLVWYTLKDFHPSLNWKFVRNFNWCHYYKLFEQRKQIEKYQRPKHANELETCIIKK